MEEGRFGAEGWEQGGLVRGGVEGAGEDGGEARRGWEKREGMGGWGSGGGGWGMRVGWVEWWMRQSRMKLVMMKAFPFAMVLERRWMMICLRWEGLVERAVGHGAVEQMKSMNLRREEESVPKRLAEMRMSLAFS